MERVKPEITVNSDGFFVEFDNKRVGPFKNPNEIIWSEVAEKLGCEPRDVLFAKLAFEQGLMLKPEETEEIREKLDWVVKEIVLTTPIKTDIRTFLMYRFNGKIWVDDVEGYIQKKLEEYVGKDYKPYYLTTVKERVQANTFVDGFEEPSLNLICFNNGVLNIETMQLEPHNPKYFFRNMIQADYNPNAQAKEFLAWLKEVMPYEEERMFLQELFGYCFYRKHSFHHLFFLVGEGRNGKGTFLRTLEGILGVKNVVHIPLERLRERFQVTFLWGKLVNTINEPDVNPSKTLLTETIKSLTGEDSQSGEIKGKQKLIDFENYAKIIVCANKLPNVSDNTFAWWSRVIVCEFPISIPQEKIIPDIERRWLDNPEERSGIVNWALEGLKRLLENRRFTKSERMQNSIEQYRKWSNSVDYFIEKCCEFKPNEWITKDELFEAYKRFCEEETLEIKSKIEFGKRISQKPRIREGSKRVHGKLERIWIGIALKPKTEDAEKLRELSDFEIFEKSETDETDETHFSIFRKSSEEEILKEYKNTVSSVSSVSVSTRVVWVCGECAKDLMQIVSLEKYGVCEVCGKTDYLGKVQELPRVKEEKPKEESENKGVLLKCFFCNAQFFTKADLEAHLKTHEVVDGVEHG